MAILFVENSSKKSRVLLRTLELMFLSVGLISTLLMVKRAVLPYSCDSGFKNLVEFWKSIKCLLYSPLCILIIINFIVIMITILSYFHRSETNDQDSDSFRVDTENLTLVPPRPTPPSAPVYMSRDLPPPSTPRRVTRAAITNPSASRGFTTTASSKPSNPWGVGRDNISQPSTPRGFSNASISQPSTPWEFNREIVSQPSTPPRYARNAVHHSSTSWDTLSQPSTPRRYARDVSQSSTPWGDTRDTVSQPATPRRYDRSTVSQPATPRRYDRSTVSQPSTPQGVMDATYVGVASSPPTRKRFTKSSNSKKLYIDNIDEFLNYLNHDNSEQSHFEQANQFSSESSSYRGNFTSKSDETKKTINSINSSSYFSGSRRVKMGPNYPPTVSVEHEEHDSLEATWRAINEGGNQRQQKKQLKKSETWDVPPRTSYASIDRLDSEEVVPSSPTWNELRKSETFNDAVSMTRRGGLQRDHSISLVDFNKRVEDFIKKGKAVMKL